MSAGAPRAARRWRFGEPLSPLREVLSRGGALAIPTESSYGLAADPRDARGVEAIFRLKGRAGSKALPVVAAGVEDLAALGVAPDDPAVAWATPRWPAALTVVARLAAPVAASAGEATLAVRIPGEPRLRELVAALGPLTATSANPSGEAPLLDPEEIAAWFAREGFDGLVVDGGRLAGGPPSTLVAWRDGAPVVLRPGRVRIA